jgi:hypothetical protein
MPPELYELYCIDSRKERHSNTNGPLWGQDPLAEFKFLNWSMASVVSVGHGMTRS